MAWMIHAVKYRCDSVMFWLNASRHGSFGKTSSIRHISKKEFLEKSFGGFLRAGICAHGELWMLNTSESPSDAVESSLWDIVDDGNELQRHYLTKEQMQNVLRRLRKYGADKSEFAKSIERYLAGQEMKPQNME